jgi:hypothetical protein
MSKTEAKPEKKTAAKDKIGLQPEKLGRCLLT